jgi:hypothetical protein
MNEVGFSVLPGYLKAADLEELRQFVKTAVEATGGKYVAFTGAKAVVETLLKRLSFSPPFVNLLHQVYEVGSRRHGRGEEVLSIRQGGDRRDPGQSDHGPARQLPARDCKPAWHGGPDTALSVSAGRTVTFC